MQPTLTDDLAAFIRARMAAAAADKALYDRSGARLNGQLLQGELNMGAAVLTWLERRAPAQAGAADEGDDEPGEQAERLV